MNLGALVTEGFRRAPAESRKPIVFTDKDGNTITGEAVGVPASGTPADGFEAGTVIRDKNRRLSVLVPDDSDPPTSGMTATWEDTAWMVTAVSPPMAPGFHRVTLGK